MAKKKNTFMWGIITAVLAGTAGWAFYSLINMVLEDTLGFIGIVGQYPQRIIIVVVIVALLAFSGLGLKKSLKRIA